MNAAYLAPIALLLSTMTSCASSTMSPNVYIEFQCNGCDVPAMEDKFYDFVASKDLSSINLTRYIKAHGKNTPFSTDVVGYSHDYMIQLEKIGYYHNKYHAMITSRPPSSPSKSDATALKQFVDGIPNTTITEIRFAENPASSLSVFLGVLKTYQGWADQMARGVSE